MDVPSKCTIAKATDRSECNLKAREQSGGRGRCNAQRKDQNTQKNRLHSMSVKKTRKLLLCS
jgi:hypothetical protein